MTAARQRLLASLNVAIESGNKARARVLAETLAKVDNPAKKMTIAGGGAGIFVSWLLTTQWEALSQASTDVQIIAGGLLVTILGGIAGPLYRGVVKRLERWEDA